MTSWAWKPDSRTRAAIRRGDDRHRHWQRRVSEQIAAELRSRRKLQGIRADLNMPPELAGSSREATKEAADVVGIGRTIVGQAKDAA